MSRALALTALVSIWLGLPASSQACAVCFSGSDESRMAFILTTIFMSLLPLAMIGGVVTWFALRIRRQNRVEPIDLAAFLEPQAETGPDQARSSSVRP